LDLFANLVHELGGGPVLDVGCGFGRIAGYLDARGLEVAGLDLSPAMIKLAKREHPGLSFEVGSMTDMQAPAGSHAGLVAWSSLIHLPDNDVPPVLKRVHRTLRPCGVVLISFFIGDRVHHKTQGYGGHPMDVDVHHRPMDRMTSWLETAGLTVELQAIREPASAVPGGIVLARRA
jgi:SAM-dependent methyltransferase